MTEQGAKGNALHAGWRLESCKIGEGGVDIHQFHHGLGGGRSFGQTRGPQDERNAGPDIEKSHFSPEEVVAQMVAVIRSEEDNGVVPLTA